MYLNYNKIKKIHLSLLLLFVTRTRKEGRDRRKELERRMAMSFLAHRMTTRKGVAREVGNPVHNSGDRGR